MKYDYLIVGAGLFGAVFAHEAHKKGKNVLVIDKRDHIAGNIYTENIEGINVHKYGAHIFHTDDKEIWNYINQFAEFNRYTNSPIARFGKEIYNLPFNMNTFTKIWPDIFTPSDAMKKIEEEKAELKIIEPQNLEEQAISLVGKTIYEKLVKGYTEKQWNRPCKELPAFIIKRLPVRFTYDNNYFTDRYQGIAIGGYTKMIEKMLEGIEVRLNCDFLENREYYKNIASKIIYTGKIDEYFDYQYGELEYRSLYFDTKIFDVENYQGNAVINYTGSEVKYTRVIEHKHFEFLTGSKSVVTFEYPDDWNREKEAYYTINDEKNNHLYQLYDKLGKEEKNIVFGGRLGLYQYYDMDDIIKLSLEMVTKEIK
ncbi:MAG: UDP-galactopyranose mutase [Bacilli bacterium]|nr:UDP-galactopyranose mutase [Bacilli bacterium]